MATLFGRELEVETLSALIGSVHERGAALVVRGEAGMGKSALLAEAKRYAEGRGSRVLATVGIQAEAALPFAGLHQLLRPVLFQADGLPGPQRGALRIAFGMDAGEVPDLFLVGLATLNLLGEAAVQAPLLLLIDDSQWLDRPTSDVLAFVARRLEADPVVMLVVARDGHACSLVRSVLPEVRLGALAPAAAAALLDARAPGLARAVRDRVLHEAAGNPLALTELPAALEAAGLEDGVRVPPQLPLTERLERTFTARLVGLPEATRTLLLVAAASEGGRVDEILSATSALAGRPVAMEDVSPALVMGLVEASGVDLRFAHPLMRSSIYQTAYPVERQAAHAALADVLVDDPDRRVWHRAAAVLGPDEDVAAEFDAAAERAQRRGALAVAAAALERAAEFSTDSAEVGRRLLQAASLRFDLGQHDEGAQLLREAERQDLRPRDVLWLSWYRELFVGTSWSGSEQARAFADVADQMRSTGDPKRALDALQTVALRCYWSNPDGETQDILIAAAERVPTSESDPKLVNVLALIGPEQRGAVVLDRIARLPLGVEHDPAAAFLLGDAASAVGDYERSTRFLEAAVAGLRAQGRLGLLAQALVSQAWTAAISGNWNLGRRAAEEAGRLAQETAQPLYMVVGNLAAAVIAAYRGETETAETLAAGGEQVLLPIGARTMLSLVEYPRGVAALADGRHADAFEHLRRIFDPTDAVYHPFVQAWALVDLLDAAVHAGRLGEVAPLVRPLEALAERTGSPLLRVGLRFARPLLAPDGTAESDAEDLFRAGLDANHDVWPFRHARLQLVYGEWLRRQRRVADSRPLLRFARDAFDALGAVPWGERARQELRAAGEASRNHTPEAWDALSPQELQIAQMAADGMTNKEIGEQLYLSHRTVGSHLYRVFPKLGITARSQLRVALHGAGRRPS